MNILVRNKDLGFFTQKDVTVQRFAKIDGEIELLWCNHAGATSEEVENCDYKSEGTDWVTKQYIYACDKCPATRDEYSTYWDDCPADGVYND